MQKHQKLSKVLALFAMALLGWLPTNAADKTSAAPGPARMTVTLQVLDESKRVPEVKLGDVIVTQGKERVQVSGWEAARGERAGLDLFILIDEASDTRLGAQLGELRDFINAQPPTTLVGIGYMRNGTVQVAQDLTTDHDKAARALRLPIASSGAYGSPYLSVIDLMKRLPETTNRREVLMITDGIDRFRGGPRYRGLSFISPDADSASSVAQRTGTIVHTIFTRGVGRLGSNYWEITNGQNAIAKLAEESGGQSYFMGIQNPVSLKPYLDDLQRTLENQYVLEFSLAPAKKAGLQSVKLGTEVAGVELGSADSVWVAK